MRFNRPIFSLLLALPLMGICLSTEAAVFYSKDEAFELAFGKDAEIVEHPVYLSDEESAEIEKRSQIKPESQLITFFEGHQKGSLVGYAVIDSHTVRTQTETVLVVLSPKGELIRTELLAFHEPPEYKPGEGWLKHLEKRNIPDLRLNHGVDGIAGATLSSRAILNSIRKTLATFQVAVQKP